MKAHRIMKKLHSDSDSPKPSKNKLRTFWRKGDWRKTSLVLALIAAACQANAASVIDSFNDISGTNAVDGSPLTKFSTTATAGGIGFVTGYDQGNSQVDVIRTNDLSVSITNYVSGQTNSANHWSVTSDGLAGAAARRSKYRDTTPLNGTIWFSFLASLQNANGDIGLTFNGAFGSAGRFGTTAGMRVGVGNPSYPGAFGVGTVASDANLANITNGVNGAITTNGIAPTNGTAGLVLGRISTTPGTGYPKVDLWYNPEVANEAALPTPTLTFIDTNSTFVPTTVSRIGYQVVRNNATKNEVIDNVKLSDEPNGFDIVYKNAPLPIPVLNVTVVSSGSESGPTNVQFLITSDRVIEVPLTVTYTVSGIATNGFDGSGFVDADFTDPNFNVGSQVSSFTIPAGQSNAIVALSVIDDALPEGDESVFLTLNPSSDYVAGVSAGTVILENNDANTSLQYMFNHTVAPQIWDTNMTASAMKVSGISGGYSTTAGYFVSPDSSIRAPGNVTPNNAADAIANGTFMSFSVAPVLGRGLSLTNIEFQALYGNYLFQEPGAAAAVVFLRSSLDNFTTDLGNWTLQPDTVVYPAWYDLNLSLGAEFASLSGGVEFRLYIYDDTTQSQVGVRVDNFYVRGGTFSSTGFQQVNVTATVTNAAEPSIPGEFTITRAGDTTNPLTVQYTISGTASNGVDYATLPVTAVIPAGQSNVVIPVTPLDDLLIEPSETVVLSLLNDASYGIVNPSSATVNLGDNGDIGGLVGYLFNEVNNSVASLADIAAAQTMLPDKVIALNASSGPGNGNFGANLTSGVGHGYATSLFHSSPGTLYIRGEYIGKTQEDSITQGNYFSFILGPKPGYALTLTNFTAYFKMTGTNTDTTWAFLRSSLDGFSTDIGIVAVNGTLQDDPFQFWSIPLNVTNQSAQVEFRLYFYNNNGAIIRLDDVGFQGEAIPGATRPNITNIAVAGGIVAINFTGSPGDVAASFKLQSSATVDGSYVNDDSATVSGSDGYFQVTAPVNGTTRFYRIGQ